MNILPFTEFIITTNIDRERIYEKIQKCIDDEAGGLFYNIKDDMPFRGKVVEDGFILTRLINYINSFLPIIKGKIVTNNGTNFVKITMRLNIFVALFWSEAIKR